MKSTFKILFGLMLFGGSLQFTSCKSKNTKETKAEETIAPAPQAPANDAPVVIAPDDALQSGVKDAIKDYPGVNATVANNEITLTGEIERAKLQPLMQSLNTLRPKKINNNLTIK